MTGAALFHKLCENTSLIAVLPFRCHGIEKFMAHRALFPEWNDDFFLNLHVFFRYLEADKLTVVHNLHICQSVTAKLREGRS